MCYIAYYRVSTSEQGISHLGIEAQMKAVRQFVKTGELQAEYTEIESGKNDNRPELSKALQQAKETGCTLLIAKLDRLSRNVTFISTLMDARVKFKCCDMPEADSFTIHIFAALAQKEREQISARTKAALQALKDRGVKLGGTKPLTSEAIASGNQSRRDSKANNDRNRIAKAFIAKCSGSTLQQIANELNQHGIKTSTGKQFTPTQVGRLK